MRSRRLALITCAALLLGVSHRPLAQSIPDAWKDQYGLGSGPDGAPDADPDGDGLTNAQEFAAGSHPRGTFVRLFAEGATGTLFDTRFALFNTDLGRTSRTLLRFLREDGVTIPYFVRLLPGARITIDPEVIPGLQAGSFSTIVESDTTVIADRTMMWDSRHYGSSAETGIPRASTTWYFAEGATPNDFNVFYLLQNPNPAPAEVTITYLLGGWPPLVKKYTVRPNSRTNIWADIEDPALASAELSAVIQSSLPIVAERAMYSNAGGLAFGSGHAAAGVTAPATEWFLAEGATGELFDMFVLLANPNAEAADVKVTFLRSGGAPPIEKKYDLKPRSRFTIPVDGIKGLERGEISTRVESLNGVPIMVERAMYWPSAALSADWWREGHDSTGVTSTATRWALADGESGLADATQTYVLLANPSPVPGTARVTLYFEDGGAPVEQLFALAAKSRRTIDVSLDFPEAANRRFATSIESLGMNGGPAPGIVVERSMYSDADGVHWAAGTVALATPVPDDALVPNPTSVRITAAPTQMFENGPAGSTITFTRGAADRDQTVYYAVGGTATPGSDYRALTGRVHFTAGQTAATVPVLVVDDMDAEPTETLTITLLDSSDYVIGAPALATLTISDNDTVIVPDTEIDVSRFLTQATFGPRPADIPQVKAVGYNEWISQQIAAPPSSFVGCLDVLGREPENSDLAECWTTYAVNSVDQLRLRVSTALIETMVVATTNGLEDQPLAIAVYMDILQHYAFANFRDLLQAVTLSPAMGQFLSHLKNDKPGKNHDPDENYAREVLQLFTIGLHKLNADGTPVRVGGALVPTYDQSVVEGFAHVFTGWTFAHDGEPKFYNAPENWRQPMRGIPSRHAATEKRLLDGVVLPARQTMDQATMDLELKQALDLIFNHPNVGPFIGRQLIQRLVTSNPSPAYVGRVAAVFANNGAGERGNLQSVIRAVLMDPEARDAALARQARYGHLREPMIRFVTALRAFNATSPTGRFAASNLHNEIGQGPFRSPSVFNFFEPHFSQPGPIANLGLYSPEFQISTERWVASYSNVMRNLVRSGYGSTEQRITLNLATETALAAEPLQLIEHLNLLLLGGQMSAELRNTLVDALYTMPGNRLDRRAMVAVSLVLSSPEFVVQK